MTFEHELGAGRRLQIDAVFADGGVDHLGAAAAQQARELVLGQRVGHRRHGAKDRGRVGTERHRDRERLAGVGVGKVAEVERAATVGQPAHDHLAPADHLLPVDAQVLAPPRRWHRLRAAGDRQAPGDQRPGVARPAGLYRQLREVDRIGLEHDLLARCVAHRGGLHVPQRLGHRQQPAGILQPPRRLGLLQAGEHAADIAKPVQIVRAHAQRHPFGGAEKVDQRRNFVTHWMRNQHRRPAGTQDTVSERCHFQPRRHGLCDTPQLALGLQLADEVAKVTIFHANWI